MVSGEDVECTGPRLQVHGNSGLKCDSKHRARDALRDHENSTPMQHITISILFWCTKLCISLGKDLAKPKTVLLKAGCRGHREAALRPNVTSSQHEGSSLSQHCWPEPQCIAAICGPETCNTMTWLASKSRRCTFQQEDGSWWSGCKICKFIQLLKMHSKNFKTTTFSRLGSDWAGLGRAIEELRHFLMGWSSAPWLVCVPVLRNEATQAAYNILRFQCCAHADTVELCLSLNGCTISTVPTSFNSTAELEVLIGLAQSCTPLIGAARKQPEGVFSSPSKCILGSVRCVFHSSHMHVYGGRS